VTVSDGRHEVGGRWIRYRGSGLRFVSGLRGNDRLVRRGDTRKSAWAKKPTLAGGKTRSPYFSQADSWLAVVGICFLVVFVV
jgi:hypothetical protein